MTPDERRSGERPGEQGPTGPRDPVADFFASEREDIGDLHGDDARWLEITREAGRPRRAGWVRYAAAAAAVVVVGGSAWAVGAHRGGTSVAAGRPSVTQTVYVERPAPQPSSGVSSAPSSTPPLSGASATVAPGVPSTLVPTGTAAVPVTPVPVDFAVVSVTTVRDGRLFALGRATCSGRSCALVATSTDGGATWGLRGRLPGAGVASRASVGGALTRTAGTVSDVRFATDSIGWAFGATVLRTTDGGRTWSPYPHIGGAAVLDVETDGTDVVLTTAAACQGVGCTGPVSVLRAPVTAGSASSAGDLGGVIDAGPGVTAADVGWFAGRAVISVSGGGSATAAQVLRTDGLHPIAVTGCADPGSTRLVTPASGTTLSALCPAGGAAGSLVLGVARSGDAGATWTAVTSAGPAVTDAGTVSAAASDAQHLLVVSGGSTGPNGTMTVSSDGGRSWHDPASPPPPPDRGWAWVGSPGAGTFYAVPTDPDGGFWRSTDGGETWSSLSVAG